MMDRLTQVERALNKFAEMDVGVTGCKRKDCLAVLWRLRGNSETVEASAQNGPVNGDAANCSGEVGACGCIHAEPRLLLKAAGRGVPADRGFLLTVNFSPCVPCVQLIIESGIVGMVAWRHYAAQHPRAPELLKAAGIGFAGPVSGAMHAGEQAK